MSIDTKKESQDDFSVWHNNGEKLSRFNLNELLHYLSEIPIGEIYLNSIDNDGTGNGYCVGLLNSIPKGIKTPIILAGGVGNYKHFIEGLDSKKIDAVATALLFNFISDGLCNARLELIEHGFDLPIWDIEYKRKLKDCLVV